METNKPTLAVPGDVVIAKTYARGLLKGLRYNVLRSYWEYGCNTLIVQAPRLKNDASAPEFVVFDKDVEILPRAEKV
jgi:hypothetical protein